MHFRATGLVASVVSTESCIVCPAVTCELRNSNTSVVRSISSALSRSLPSAPPPVTCRSRGVQSLEAVVFRLVALGLALLVSLVSIPAAQERPLPDFGTSAAQVKKQLATDEERQSEKRRGGPKKFLGGFKDQEREEHTQQGRHHARAKEQYIRVI